MPGPMFPGLQRGLMQQPQGAPPPQQGQPQGPAGAAAWGGMGNGWLAQQGRSALQGMGQQLGQQAWGGMDPGTIQNPSAGRPAGQPGMPPQGGVPGPAQQTQQAAAGYARGQGQALAEDDPRRGMVR